MAERGAGRAAADRGRPPATQPERERMIDALKAAFVQDRLTKDEFDERVGLVLVSRTHAELAALTADIPAGPVVVRPPRRPPRRPASGAARWSASGVIAPAILAVGLTSVSLGGGTAFGAVTVVIAIAYFLFWLSAGADMLWQWHCMSMPGAGMCVRCAHTAASHRTSASCTARPGTPKPWRHCSCAGYVPPGVTPEPVVPPGVTPEPAGLPS
jgi:uncharacterized protein DUF1707